MATINCKKCNNPVETTDKFCPHCGASVQHTSNETKRCPKCNYENPASISFCEKCGTSLKAKETAQTKASEPKTFTSAGNYSGKMVKSKSSKSYKIFKRIVLALLILAIIAFVIWFKNDPEAKEKLFGALFSVGFMSVFALVIWWYSKKGKIKSSRQRAANYDWDDDSRDDYEIVDDDFDDD